MVTIKCTVYEKRDLEVILDYAKDLLIEDCNNDKITVKLLNIELGKINKIKQRINGKVTEDYMQSSWSYNRKHGTLKEREKNDLPEAPFYRT